MREKLILYHFSPTFPIHICYQEYCILYRLPKDEDNLLHAAYTILYTVPRAIEDYIEREYAGGFLQAIRDYKDQLKAKLGSKEWDLLSQLIGTLFTYI